MIQDIGNHEVCAVLGGFCTHQEIKFGDAIRNVGDYTVLVSSAALIMYGVVAICYADFGRSVYRWPAYVAVGGMFIGGFAHSYISCKPEGEGE